MNISQTMLEILNEIAVLEPAGRARFGKVAPQQLGVELIKHYYKTETLRTRELILAFMDHAGFEWVKKLLTRDTEPMPQRASFTSLEEYTQLAAANDPRNQWFKTAN